MATVRPLQSRDELSFISRLVPDPASPPSLEVVRGYIGASAERQHTRVYLDLQLAEFVDVPDDTIKLIHRLPESVSPLGESYVWFDRAAVVIHGAVGEERRAARFLEGRLTANRSIRAESKPSQDTSPACCTPKPKPDIQPGKPSQDTSPACCTPKPKPD